MFKSIQVLTTEVQTGGYTNVLSPPSTTERTADKRFRISWSKKAIPLKNTNLFNKAQHSEEWHQSIDATAGVLRPSDSKLPYGFLRNHTDTYLKRKGKITQADVDIRIAILIASHEARDIAVAAAAHAMTAKSLRTLLHVESNVMPGNYWGLKTWLQCLIAANEGNPASVTDLEALWARKLLPFATHGPRAAEWYLVGLGRTLREIRTAGMSVLPEFSVLLKRAIADHSGQLESFRLRCQWTEAYEAVAWMRELANISSQTTPADGLMLEDIMDACYPSWRVWACWKPQPDRIQLFGGGNSAKLATVPDLAALDGPDILTGTKNTLRDGLIAQYVEIKPLMRWRGLVVEVPHSTKAGLKGMFQRVAQALSTILNASDAGFPSMLNLLTELVLARPILASNLDIFEAACKIPHTPENDVFNTVREIYLNQDQLGGLHILEIQKLVRVFDIDQSEDLRTLFLKDWFRAGINNCLEACQQAVRIHMEGGLPWTHLALEYHTFCTILQASKCLWLSPSPSASPSSQWPSLSLQNLESIVEIFEAAQAQQPKVQVELRRKPIPEKQTQEVEKRVEKVSNPSELIGRVEDSRHPLQKHIELCCVDRLLCQESMPFPVRKALEAIFQIWEDKSSLVVGEERRALAILLYKMFDTGPDLVCECLKEISSGKNIPGSDIFMKKLLAILKKLESDTIHAILEMAELLVGEKQSTTCWRDLLYSWLEQQFQPGVTMSDNILQYSLQNMKTIEWLTLINNIEAPFANVQLPHTPFRPIPSILRPDLLAWKTNISKFSCTLARLEVVLGDNREPVRYILTGGSRAKTFTTILECLMKMEDKPVELLMQRLVGKLSVKENNENDIKESLLYLASASSGTTDICQKIWETRHGILNIPETSDSTPTTDCKSSSNRSVLGKATNTLMVKTSSNTTESSSANTISPTNRKIPPSVVEVMVAGWIQSEDLDERDKSAIASVAGVLGICVEGYSPSVWKSKLTEAMNFWQDIEEEIIKEAARLESLQRALKKRDPVGTALLLKKLGIPDNDFLNDQVMKLPAGVIDLVEIVGEYTVEMSFPLSAHTELQRKAMGIPVGANNLLLRLSLQQLEDGSPSFCLHFNNDENLDSLEHSPWICSKDSKSPQDNFCTTSPSAFTWQLNRIVHTQLRIGNTKIADLYKFVEQKMGQIGHACISCGTSHNAKNAHLRRATPCSIVACARLWYQLPLEIRIPEIKTDTFAVDAMLTSVHAAAMAGRQELLPGCPIYSMETIKAILNSLPSLTLISHAVNTSDVLKSYHKDAEKLISWACVHHRGFITTATGLSKVPTMPPGTHQFVLANASPKLESDFVSKLPRYNPKTTVLFHGTSLDRLPAILAQGLKVCSGTTLQRTGAAHGKGIYMAEEPATSLIYSSATTSWRNSGLANMRLLLGCEVVGNGRRVSSGIHVITDERSIMVRYLFFLTNNASAPIANHLVPAMASGMSAMRTGAI